MPVQSQSFDNLHELRRGGRTRICILHGLNDTILNYSNSLCLFRLANSPHINLLMLSNKTHNNLMTYCV